MTLTLACRLPLPTFRTALALVIGTLAVVCTASAQTPALDFDSLGTGRDYHQGTYSLGWRFTATQDIQVSALGFYGSRSRPYTRERRSASRGPTAWTS